jgi:hypothetical protein
MSTGVTLFVAAAIVASLIILLVALGDKNQ